MDNFFMESLLSICFLLLLLYFYKPRYQSNTKRKTTNGASNSYPLIGNLLDVIKNRHQFLDWTTEILSASPTNTASLRYPGTQMVITANPLNVQHIVKTNIDCYPKGERFKSLFEDVFGATMFILDGEPWKYHKRIVVQAIAPNTFRSFAADITAEETSKRLIPTLERASRLNHVVDLQEIFECVMFDIVCKFLLDEDPGALSNDGNVSNIYLDAMQQAILIATRRFYSVPPLMWKVMRFLNVGPEQRLKHSMSIMHTYVDTIIRTKLLETELTSKDVLSSFIASGNRSIEPLRDGSIGLLLAGTDTIVAGLTWFFWLLSSNPKEEKKILAELEETRARHKKSLGNIHTSEELHEMQYLHAAITESMRLYPPSPLEWKTCSSNDVLPDGTHVKKGWNVLYNAYAMGRMEEIWGTDCLEYRPERWIEDGVFRPQSPFQFPAFNAGPRMCIGKDLAYIQMKIISASMIERFEIEVQDDASCPEMIASLTLLMKGGLPVQVRERRSEPKD